MQNLEEVKTEYVQNMRVLLSTHPRELEKFDSLWGNGKLREAYVLAHEVIKNLKLVMSADQSKADEKFFWLYIN